MQDDGFGTEIKKNLLLQKATFCYQKLDLTLMPELNRQEFEELFRSEYKGLCFFAQRYVKDLVVAREIAQDSFISLWEKRDSIDSSRSVKSYLTTTIRNKSLNYLRDNRKYDTGLLEAEQLNDTAISPDTDILVEKELHATIQQALDELPEKCREIFLLNRYENLRYNEIAVKLGISVKTVEAQISKALQHLRLRLAGFLTLLSPLILLFSRFLSKF